MTLEEAKQYMEENKSSDEVKAYLQGLVNVEGVQNFFTQSEDGKRWLDSERDKHLNKGLDTWKANNLQKEIDKKIHELYPEETEEKAKMLLARRSMLMMGLFLLILVRRREAMILSFP